MQFKIAKYVPKVVAFDCETLGLSTYAGHRPFAISMAYRNRINEIETAYVSFPVNPLDRVVDYSNPSNQEDFLKICDYLKNPTIKKVCHNTKFDVKMIRAIPLILRGPLGDTLLKARSCYTLEQTYGLKPLADKYVDIPVDDEEELRKLTIKSRNLAKKIKGFKTGECLQVDYWLPAIFFPDSKVCERYAVQDSVRCLLLDEFYEEGLDEFKVRHCYELEIRLMQTLIRMEDRGVCFHYKKCIEEIQRLYSLQQECISEFHRCLDIPNHTINLNSPVKLLKIFREKYPNLELESTGEEALDSLIPDDIDDAKHPAKWKYPVFYWFLMYKGYAKGISFLSDYIQRAVPDPQRAVFDTKAKSIHTSFNQGNTRTWRLSASEPNLQQAPDPKTSSGFNVINVRTVFGPRPGYVWYHFDFSGVEMRIFADRANEKFMLAAFLAGRDIHDECRIRVPELAVLPQKVGRKIAKNVGFCKIFGGGAKALVKYIGKDENYCRGIIKAYDSEFPTIVSYVRNIGRTGASNGFITNAFGRRINVDAEWSYRACNYDVQSSAADLMKQGMVKTEEYLEYTGLDAHIVLSIHDEIVVEIKKEHCYKYVLLEIKKLMEDHGGAFSIPTPVEVERTTTFWSEKSKQGLEWINK